MEEYSGIISLFLACIELVLLVNLLIFAEKNEVNKQIILLVGLLFGYQIFEFVICYNGIESHLIVYLAFLLITFMPPLMLNIVLVLNGNKSKIKKLIFFPAILITAYYPSIISEFVVTRCTIMFAAYDIPFADLYGIIYYTPVLASIIILVNLIQKKDTGWSKSNLLIFTIGIILTFIPTLIIILIFPSLIEFIESFFCKSAFFIALAASIFAISNKMKVLTNE